VHVDSLSWGDGVDDRLRAKEGDHAVAAGVRQCDRICERVGIAVQRHRDRGRPVLNVAREQPPRGRVIPAGSHVDKPRRIEELAGQPEVGGRTERRLRDLAVPAVSERPRRNASGVEFCAHISASVPREREARPIGPHGVERPETVDDVVGTLFEQPLRRRVGVPEEPRRHKRESRGSRRYQHWP
jgi:hypothetical protein